MDIRTAIIKSMKAYYNGLTPQELKAASPKGMKYTKKYFDKVGKDYDIEPVELKKGKGKSGY
jgi:hypothetical protein